MTRRILIVATLAALALGGCATIPQPLQGEFPTVTLDAARSGAAGAVRWGGQIIQTEPQAQQTCFFVLAQPLDSQARPRSGMNSTGRFVACKSGFYDPEVFVQGREITVTGTLDGTMERKIGDFNYTYPKVAANNVYLWQPRPPVTAYPDPWMGFCDPFWSPWGCGWGPGPWFYPPRVIVAPRPVPPPPPPKH